MNQVLYGSDDSMSPQLLSRRDFREQARDRDNDTCIVPWCDEPVDDVHHIIERSLWSDGGYYLRNAASVCNPHHQRAEENLIPPHAFWRWLAVDPLTPESYDTAINKWGDSLDAPPWPELKDYYKYPSSRHLPFSHSRDVDDTEFRVVDAFIGTPLVVTIKMDGGNTMLVKDSAEPVRARNGTVADHPSYDQLKAEYWERNLYEKIPEHLQICGEWVYACHSIHYGCDGCCKPRNQGPELDAYFYVFGVFDTRYNLWLSWPETEQWADEIGYPTAPVVRGGGSPDDVLFSNSTELYDELVADAERVVNAGHEGLVVRNTYPYHYGQFSERLGKYVRENHVEDGATHWSHRDVTPNKLKDPTE